MSWLFDTELISAVQSALGTTIAWLFIFFTLLGEDIFYIVLIAAIYWCFHKKGGIAVAYVMLFGFYINYFFKMLLNRDRPPDAYRIIGKGDISHGFPSGHAQSATTFWTWALLKTKLKALLIISPFMIFMVSFSRIYLGVHYPGDVIGGTLIGLVYTLIAYLAYPQIASFLGRHSTTTRQVIVPVIALVLFASSLVIFPDTTRDDPATVCGALFGFSVGLAFESKYIDFKTEKLDNKKRIMRLLTGGVVVGVLYVGLSPILPSANVFMKFVRYAIVTFGAAFIAPGVFNYIEKRK
ncbi:MAG: phosphatase PAP2 family protein [Promethearchaeati archaeon SRVP18_Atabeyarchaeia-1]